jgi:hypothetical protein
VTRSDLRQLDAADNRDDFPADVALVPIQRPGADARVRWNSSQGWRWSPRPIRSWQGSPPPSMYRMNSCRALSAPLFVAKPPLIFWRLWPVMGWGPMSTTNSHVRCLRTCPRIRDLLRVSAGTMDRQRARGGPADFASAVRSSTREKEVVANGVPTPSWGVEVPEITPTAKGPSSRRS